MRLVSRAGLVMTTIWGVALGLLLTNSPSVEARPEYKKGFDTKYKEFYDKANTKITCDVCHVKDQKKTERGEYGAQVWGSPGREEGQGHEEDRGGPRQDRRDA